MGETLTFQQICYLHAVISGEKAITSAETQKGRSRVFPVLSILSNQEDYVRACR